MSKRWFWFNCPRCFHTFSELLQIPSLWFKSSPITTRCPLCGKENVNYGGFSEAKVE